MVNEEQALRIVLADADRIQSHATSWDAYQMYLEAEYLRFTWATENDLEKAMAALKKRGWKKGQTLEMNLLPNSIVMRVCNRAGNTLGQVTLRRDTLRSALSHSRLELCP